MKSLKDNYYNRRFSHIYVEKDIKETPKVKEILSHFKAAQIIEIDHYKDVFCRGAQDYVSQHKSQKLILAKKTGELIYEGAPVCQSFGNKYFYYTSCMMNCVFDCEYCYLKGMYSSANMVIFINIEDIFAQTEEILKKHDAYICVSYDTDMLAMEKYTDYCRQWVLFTQKHPGLTIEVRTKSATAGMWDNLPLCDNVIYAFTMSPQKIIEECEHYTPSLDKRIRCAKEGIDRGYKVRLCFDPMIYCSGWKEQYADMLDKINTGIDMSQVVDVSVGSFRVSQDYLKKMRKNEPDSSVVQFPYINEGGVYCYGKELTEQMEGYLTEKLSKMMPQEKIFRWRD